MTSKPQAQLTASRRTAQSPFPISPRRVIAVLPRTFDIHLNILSLAATILILCSSNPQLPIPACNQANNQVSQTTKRPPPASPLTSLLHPSSTTAPHSQNRHHVDVRRCAFLSSSPSKTRIFKADHPHPPVEHNTPEPSAATQAPRRRPDLSSFFATLREITPAPDHRPHAVPVPGDVSAAFLSLADAYEVLRNQARSHGGNGNEDSSNDEMVNTMIQTLLSDANSPPREVEGASEEFCAGEEIPVVRLGIGFPFVFVLFFLSFYCGSWT